MARPPFNPQAVDWSGENPGMYLKETPDGPFVALISFFRVVTSPHGKGHAAFMLLDPHGEGKSPERPNVCLTDNEPLANYLKQGFVSNFGSFKGVKGLSSVQMKPGWDFVAAGDGRSSHTEWFRSAIGQVNLTWNGLSAPFMVELMKEQSATGRHEMFSLFLESTAVTATINGKPVAGKSVAREWLGRKSTTAFLAFSETWIKA
ncbi:MAG TPA: hypothetical protein VHA15_12335 [Burkholderiales bacterium]|jgi:hypothetical protein|nr:hypothetical protein [Burkholderiales bacterium]